MTAFSSKAHQAKGKGGKSNNFSLFLILALTNPELKIPPWGLGKRRHFSCQYRKKKCV